MTHAHILHPILSKKAFSAYDDQFKRADNETEMFVGWINIYHVKVSISVWWWAQTKLPVVQCTYVRTLCASAWCEWMCCSWCFEQFTFEQYVCVENVSSVFVYMRKGSKQNVILQNKIRASKGKERRHKKWSALIKMNFSP